MLKDKLRKRWVGLALAGALLGAGITTVTTVTEEPKTAAQAFSEIRYWAQCPSSNQWQVLTIRNYSGARVYWNAFRNGSGTLVKSGYVNNMDAHSATIPDWNVTYAFGGSGSLNWFYEVNCY